MESVTVTVVTLKPGILGIHFPYRGFGKFGNNGNGNKAAVWGVYPRTRRNTWTAAGRGHKTTARTVRFPVKMRCRHPQPYSQYAAETRTRIPFYRAQNRVGTASLKSFFEVQPRFRVLSTLTTRPKTPPKPGLGAAIKSRNPPGVPWVPPTWPGSLYPLPGTAPACCEAT